MRTEDSIPNGTRQSAQGSEAGLVCVYCRSALPCQIKANSGLCRCPRCRRFILVNDRLARIGVGEDHVVVAWVVPFAIVAPGALALVLLLPLVGNMLLAIPMWLCLMWWMAELVYDGYLGIVTGLHSFMGLGLSSGRGAVISGVWGILLGAYGAAMLVYTLFGALHREITGRWP